MADGTTQPEPVHATNKNPGRGQIALGAANLLASLVLLALLAALGWAVYHRSAAAATPQPTAIPTLTPAPRVDLPPFQMALAWSGIGRLAEIHTTRPDYSRFEIREYEVQPGDTIIGIAEKFGLKSQTILWGNYNLLYDDPHRLNVGMKIKILPMDGVLYTWSEGDGLNGVSSYFKVKPEDIINWPTNNLNPETIGDYSHPNIEVGKELFVPGGQREFISYSVPVISRTDPAKAKVLGPGYCGSVVGGAVGNGTFVWPTTNPGISGYNYDPGSNHMGIDIAGSLGNPVYATDSGVVVYAGWNDSGYGNLIVIDHGNGWQSLYAHLNSIGVSCGMGVVQGGTIGTVGSTGRSTGPHLHFEIMNASGVRVNPLGLTSP